MKKFILSALALVLFSAAAMAQRGNGRQFNPAQMYQTMAENLAKQLKLKKEKADNFKLLYIDYQNARANAENPRGEANNEKIDVKKMTDEEANALIQQQFDAQEAQLAIDKEYLAKFLEILTPVEAAQVFVRRLSMQSMMGGMGNMMRGMNRGGGFGGGGGLFLVDFGVDLGARPQGHSELWPKGLSPKMPKSNRNNGR